MNNMTQEEKARAYDEALERARKMLNMILDNELLGFPDQIREIFPQLKESKDEKIREKMIRYFTEMKEGGSAALPYDDCIAYLEKQKDLDKMIVVSPEVWDKAIADAYENGKKDGEKQKEQKPDMLQNAFDKSKKDYTLEEKSKASDYAESILPTSIMYGESEEEYKLHTIIEAAFIAGQEDQKPAEWNDSDMKEARNNLISVCRDWERGEKTTLLPVVAVRARYFLEHLTEPKCAVWSKEDENKIERLAFLVSVVEEKEMISPSESIDLRNFIKSLRPQPKKELSIEKAIQWLDDTFYFLDNSSGRGRDCEITTHDFDSLEEMYDSFRKAVIVDSEPHWKPSEAQMEMLKYTIDYYGSHTPNELVSLYEQLKKL